MTAYATVDTAVAAMKIGVYDYLVKPFDPEELSVLVQKIVAQQALLRENVLLRKVLKRGFHFRDLVGKSPEMRAVFELARTAARSQSTVLVSGESGTGKQLLARAIHAESPRSHGPFLTVPCAALTEALLERELFGCEKDALAGAAPGRRARSSVPGAARFCSTKSRMSAPAFSSTCCVRLRIAPAQEGLRLWSSTSASLPPQAET